MDGFHFWNKDSLGHNTRWAIFGVERLFAGICGENGKQNTARIQAKNSRPNAMYLPYFSTVISRYVPTLSGIYRA